MEQFVEKLKKWKCEPRSHENPPDGDLEGHFFNVFSHQNLDLTWNTILVSLLVILSLFRTPKVDKKGSEKVTKIDTEKGNIKVH